MQPGCYKVLGEYKINDHLLKCVENIIIFRNFFFESRVLAHPLFRIVLTKSFLTHIIWQSLPVKKRVESISGKTGPLKNAHLKGNCHSDHPSSDQLETEKFFDSWNSQAFMNSPEKQVWNGEENGEC